MGIMCPFIHPPQNKPLTQKLKNEILKLSKKHRIRQSATVKQDLEKTVDLLKQKPKAAAVDLRRYTERTKWYQENKIYNENALLFFRNLEKNEGEQREYPPEEETTQYWAGIWEQPVTHNEPSHRIPAIENNSECVHPMSESSISTQNLQEVIKPTCEWKSPGVDKLYGFWFNLSN